MLNLLLTLDKDVYRSGNSIRVKVILKNTGTASILANSRLALNTPFAPARLREITFTVTRPDGERPDFEAKVNLGAPQAKHFKALGPDETVEHTYNLDIYYTLDQPGAYRLQAIYQNQSDPGDGRAAWKGELMSNTVAFQIEA